MAKTITTSRRKVKAAGGKKPVAKAAPKLVKKRGKNMEADTMKWAGMEEPWKMLAEAVKLADRVGVVGPPGVGKSYLAANSGQNFYQVSLSEDFSVQELLGHFIPRGNLFEWHDGPVARAMREGCILILNEISRASSAVLDVLLGILDDPDICSVALPTGEKLTPTKGFKVVATSNSPFDMLDPALQDRFEVIIHVPGPNPSLVDVLNRRVGGLGTMIGNSFKDPKRAWSTRKALAFAKFRERGVPEKIAAAMAFGNRGPDFLIAAKTAGVNVEVKQKAA